MRDITKQGLHLNRAVGRYSDHCHPGLTALTGLGQGKGAGKQCRLQIPWQITLGTIYYCDDHDGRMLQVLGPGKPYGSIIAPYLGDKRYVNDPQAAYEDAQ